MRSIRASEAVAGAVYHTTMRESLVQCELTRVTSGTGEKLAELFLCPLLRCCCKRSREFPGIVAVLGNFVERDLIGGWVRLSCFGYALLEAFFCAKLRNLLVVLSSCRYIILKSTDQT